MTEYLVRKEVHDEAKQGKMLGQLWKASQKQS